MNKRILLIGDESGSCTNAIIKFKKKYEVEHIKYLRTAFIKKLDRYQLIIVEIMTTSSDIYTKEETSNDLKTGIVYYEKEIEKLGIPVLFWSWSEYFCEEIESKKSPLLGFVHKTFDYDFLVNAVDEFLKNINQTKKEK